MDRLTEAKGSFLLEKSLSDFHKEATRWLSEVELWKIELSLFQKLLDKHAPDLCTTQQRMEIDHFQNLIIYYNGELLDEFKHELHLHERNLASAVKDEGKVSDVTIRDEHASVHMRLDAFETEFKNYKKELFEFIEKLL